MQRTIEKRIKCTFADNSWVNNGVYGVLSSVIMIFQMGLALYVYIVNKLKLAYFISLISWLQKPREGPLLQKPIQKLSGILLLYDRNVQFFSQWFYK